MTTNNSKAVYEIAILGRVTWNLHSLNNEGTIGNVVEPRTLKLADGTTADGVSGEMLKHIHAVKLWELEVDKRKFCPICQGWSPCGLMIQIEAFEAAGCRQPRGCKLPSPVASCATCTAF